MCWASQHFEKITPLSGDWIGRVPEAIWTVDKTGSWPIRSHLFSVRSPCSAFFSPQTRKPKRGNKCVFSSFMIQRKLWCFLGDSERSFIIIKTETGVLILLWKSNKKHTTHLSCQESAMESAARSTASSPEHRAFVLTLHEDKRAVQRLAERLRPARWDRSGPWDHHRLQQEQFLSPSALFAPGPPTGF